MNCPDFELLSAHADGETTPAEAALIEQHSGNCSSCAQQLANLGLLSRAVRQPQALPAGFKIRVQPAKQPSLWQKLRELADSPVVHLVSAQRRRRARFGLLEMAKIVAIFALPIFFMTISSDRSPLLTFMGFSAVGLMIGLPLRQFSEEVALLASLRRGRCLEEIIGTGTSAQGLLDGLALQGLGQLTRAALTVWPVLLLGSLALPHSWKQRALQSEVAWLPCLLTFFLGGYYLSQLLNVWKGGWPRRLVKLLFALSPWTLVLLGLPGCLVASLLTAGVARHLAISELENPERLQAVPPGRRNRLVRCWSQNPITRREMSRLASGLGGGWWRLFVWRTSLTLAPLAWALFSLNRPLDDWQEVFSAGLLGFAALFFARAAAVTLPAVVREREQQSWGILMQTPLGPRTVVEGWLQVSCYTLFSEGLFAMLALGGYLVAAVPPAHLGWPLASLGLLPLVGWLGAYVGLALSASSRSLREAGQKWFLWCLLALLGWLVGWGLGQGLTSASYFLGPTALLALLPVAFLLWLRALPLMRLLPSLDPCAEEQAAGRYSPVLAGLDLGSLLALGFALVCWNILAKETDLSALKGATLLLGAGLAWLLCLRLPLATIAEFHLGHRFSLLLGSCFGLWLGWTGFQAIRALSFQLREPQLLNLEVEYGCLLAGVIAGAVCGGLAARAARPGPARRRQLCLRLRWSGLLVMGGLLLLWMGDRLWQLPSAPEVKTVKSPLNSAYRKQLQVVDQLIFPASEIFLRNEKFDEFPSDDSKQAWIRFAKRHAAQPALARLRRQLPPFETPQSEIEPVEEQYSWASHYLVGLLRTQSVLYRLEGNEAAAFNCLRWALLCLDSRTHWQSDFEVSLNPEGDEAWLLDELRDHIAAGQGADGLIEQLQEDSRARRWLLFSYQNLEPNHLAYNFSHSPIPRAYLDREELARTVALKRAQQWAGEFKLWELSHDGGAGLLEGIRFTPLARRIIYRVTVSNGVRSLARSRTRREGLALLAAIQLYRRDHDHKWPDNLEQVQGYLPRPARSYLNQAGSFDYSPGILSCSRDDGTERLLIYQEGQR
ncbi:MAG: zf-HC2 domain-containing protein [Candidatus Eremiobacteraeota bacterium]|nr:zf-HC2 domain-containing protein [Candidatus Eremiobacteraeota bacterium]MCW5867248.1 zf-HC2 domain-containing protein [Candidatus Eremiobacteraeota bacterium]